MRYSPWAGAVRRGRWAGAEAGWRPGLEPPDCWGSGAAPEPGGGAFSAQTKKEDTVVNIETQRQQRQQKQQHGKTFQSLTGRQLSYVLMPHSPKFAVYELAA